MLSGNFFAILSLKGVKHQASVFNQSTRASRHSMSQGRRAKVHTSVSQRAKLREGIEQKVTFKAVFDNPHRISWPSIPVNLQNSILAHLVNLLDGMADYRRIRGLSPRKREKLFASVTGVGTDAFSDGSGETSTGSASITKQVLEPTVAEHLVYGINEVTRRLEKQIEETRPKINVRKTRITRNEEENPSLRYLFVCREDVDPPILINHLPHLVAIYNTLRKPSLPATILVPLPKGAQLTLAQLLGVRRLAVLAIDSKYLDSTQRLSQLDSLPIVSAPWLASEAAQHFVQTHIKQTRTTAPLNMKASKESRMKGKAAAKERRKAEEKRQTLRFSSAQANVAVTSLTPSHNNEGECQF